MALPAGSRIGTYHITATIGAGGMGEVYRARDTKLERDVALKILPESFASDPDRLMRFEREAKTLASLNHPHIAQIYGIEESLMKTGHSGLPATAPSGPPHAVSALVMELVDGEDLAERLARGPIPIEEAMPIARQIAQALEAAHAAGIVHRDLKPANIKVRVDGAVKVLDFGLAKTGATSAAGGTGATGAMTSPAMTQAGLILGTAAYMSPEQAKGKIVDKRTDIWAFGCVLYEMLSGRRAFAGDDVSDTLASILKDEADLSALPRTAHSALRVLLRRCLQRDPARRISDASALLFVLDEIDSLGTSDEQVDAQDVHRQIAEAVSQRRRAWLRWVVPVVAALVIAVGALAAALLMQSSPPPPLTTRFAIPVPPEQRALSALNRGVVAVSNDGSRMAWAATTGIYARSMSDPTAHLVPGTESTVNQANTLTFSPDGASLAFVVANQIKRIALNGGTPVDVCAIAPPFGMTWTDAGIVVGQGPLGVRRCSPDGGAPEQLVTAGDGEEIHGAQLLPGGDSILMSIAKSSDGTARWDRAQIVVQSLGSGERKPVLSGGSDPRYVLTGHLLYVVGGIVFAVPFDPSTATVRGGAVPVIEGVRRPVGAVSAVAHYAVSPTGTLLYLPGEVRPTFDFALAIADRTGAVTTLPLSATSFRHVRVAPDGKRLVIGTDNDKEAIVWLYELGANTALQRLTLDGNNRFPIWSPDGQRVAFQSDREGDRGIYVQRIDGSVPAERITRAEKEEAHVPESWSPDGSTLAYSVERNGTFRLSMFSFTGRTSNAFGAVSSLEPLSATFSPDGRWLMYTNSLDRGGQPLANRGVFIQPFPPTGTAYQVPKQGLDFHPAWSASGREIVFVVSAASGRIAVVPISVQPRVTFGTPALLAARVTADRTSGLERAWDVLPDGRFVGLVNPAQPEGTIRQAELRVVLNWFEELTLRLPRK
jgi:serine/threonine-protein kinase